MKVGDLVKCNHPSWFHTRSGRIGVIVAETPASRSLNKSFKVLWHNGTTGNNVSDYDLELLNESR